MLLSGAGSRSRSRLDWLHNTAFDHVLSTITISMYGTLYLIQWLYFMYLQFTTGTGIAQYIRVKITEEPGSFELLNKQKL